MLINFEEITEDLNDYEIKKILPLIANGLLNYKGKQNAISGSLICKRFNERNSNIKYKLNPVKLRKIISCIRLRGDVMHLCSNSKGYYIAKDINELDDCIESLEQRISQQMRVVKSLVWQRNQQQAS